MHRRGNEVQPWGLVGVSIVILLLAIGVVGVVAVLENERVKDTAERAIAFDVEIEDNGDDLRVAVLNMRHYHRNIAFGGFTPQAIDEFDNAYAELLEEIDELEEIGVGGLDITQPDELRAMADLYYREFRPWIPQFTSQPTEFNAASAEGLRRIQELDAAAEEIDDLGEDLTEVSLSRVQSASARARIVLISLMSGVALVGIALAVTAGRVLDRFRTANAQEQAAAQQLAEALRAKTDFIADASHELRTPLTLIRGNAEIGLATPGEPEDKQAFDEIMRQSTRMSRLVDDLLLLAQSDAGTIPMEREYVPVGWLLQRIGPSAEAMTRHNDRCLELDMQATGHLFADPQRIEQIISIAVDNACKYAPEETCVEVTARSDDGFLTFEVIDFGPGVPPDELPRILERFYQVGERRARKKGGSGLGLAIAKSITEAHDGTIAVDNHPRGGARVTIRLPLADEP